MTVFSRTEGCRPSTVTVHLVQLDGAARRSRDLHAADAVVLCSLRLHRRKFVISDLELRRPSLEAVVLEQKCLASLAREHIRLWREGPALHMLATVEVLWELQKPILSARSNDGGVCGAIEAANAEASVASIHNILAEEHGCFGAAGFLVRWDLAKDRFALIVRALKLAGGFTSQAEASLTSDHACESVALQAFEVSDLIENELALLVRHLRVLDARQEGVVADHRLALRLKRKRPGEATGGQATDGEGPTLGPNAAIRGVTLLTRVPRGVKTLEDRLVKEFVDGDLFSLPSGYFVEMVGLFHLLLMLHLG
mmetsp:Transcript_16968/g.43958  ORF Transcript_16968/g.43958 Transcript_16968/m.43958 type:complete len:311 (+) Transcript_16968:3090-4022(+)